MKIICIDDTFENLASKRFYITKGKIYAIVEKSDTIEYCFKNESILLV